MLEFRQTPLSDIGRIVTGRTPPTQRPELLGSGVAFITPSDISEESIYPSPERRLSKEGERELARILLPPAAVCFTCIASIGKMCLTREASATNQQINSIIVDQDRFDARWLFYALKAKREAISKLASGSATPIINKTAFGKVTIDTPDYKSQRRISEILGAYDDLIEVNRRRIRLLGDMVRGLFEEWFVRFRFPGHESVEIVETSEGALPHGWEWAALGDLCSRITDGAHRSPTSVANGRRMASVRDMREWGFDYSTCRMIADDEYEELVRGDCQPRTGDILIAKDGANLNKHTFLVWKSEPVVLLSSIAIIRPRADIQKEYLVALLRSDRTSAAIKAMRSGAAIPRIVLKDFRRLVIMLPPVEIRNAFEQAITPLHQLCRRLSESNSVLAASRDLLLPQLISGQLSIAGAERELMKAA